MTKNFEKSSAENWGLRMKIDESLSFLREHKKELLQKKIEYLKENVEGLRYMILFGSYARGEEKATSDLDVLLLTTQEIPREVRGELCSEYEEEKIDLVFYTMEQFESSDCLLISQIRKEGIVVWKQR